MNHNSTRSFRRNSENMKHHGKILVVRGGAIGDFILTLPVFAALRRQFPEARLEVLGYPHIARLALAGGLVDEVCSIDARTLAGFFARDGQLDAGLSEYFSGFSVIVSYLFDPDGIFQENVARCSKVQFIAGPHRPEERSSLHETEVLLKPLERLAVFDADPVPRLKVEQASSPSACCAESNAAHETIGSSRKDAQDARPTVALHPGSGSERKNWPEENWMRLIQHLQTATKFNFLMAGGEAELERLRRLSAVFHPDRLQLAQCLPLFELAWRLQRCRGFIGHDSGITHLAAAAGLPVLVFWGEANETVWRPRAERVTVLRSPEGLQGLSVERVIEELELFLPKEETS